MEERVFIGSKSGKSWRNIEKPVWRERASQGKSFETIKKMKGGHSKLEAGSAWDDFLGQDFVRTAGILNK